MIFKLFRKARTLPGVKTIAQVLVPTESNKAQVCVDKIKEARKLVPYASYWRHYKGGVYMVNGYAIDTDDGEVRIRYERVDGPDFDYMLEDEIEFVRPLAEWLSMVPLPYGCDEEGDLVIPPSQFPRFVPVKSINRKEWIEK